MPPDHVTGHELRAGAGRASHAEACARAGLFAVLGTVLATLGHHAIAEGAVPWRLVGALTAAQFASVRPLVRRRYAPVMTALVMPVTQGVLHLVLSYADGDTSVAMAQHALRDGHMAGAGDGHTWHHAGAAMTTVHAAAALIVAWLLHRADVRMTAALGALRTLVQAAAAALARVVPRVVGAPDEAMPRLPGRRTDAFIAVAVRALEEVLEHAVVRRGPPRCGATPVLHRP